MSLTLLVDPANVFSDAQRLLPVCTATPKAAAAVIQLKLQLLGELGDTLGSERQLVACKDFQSVLLVMSTIKAACESRARGRSEGNGALEQPWYRS